MHRTLQGPSEGEGGGLPGPMPSLAEKQAPPAKNHSAAPAQKVGVSLTIRGYDNIFSDFDPRHYTDRMFSQDFLNAARNVVKETPSGGVELEIMLQSDRNFDVEEVIRRRLREHFKMENKKVARSLWESNVRGAGYVGVGSLILAAKVLVNYFGTAGNLVTNIPSEMLGALGGIVMYLGIWGAHSLKKETAHDREFYEKMRDCEVTFRKV